jgi:hypothetical protein
MTDALDEVALARLEQRIDAWMERERTGNPLVAAVDRGEPGERRWYLRLRGETKEYTTIWFVLGQRTLQFEAYVLPAPEEHHAEVYEQLLRRNRKLVGVHFCLGDEDAVYLVGALPLVDLREEELDRVVGTVWATVEQCFRPTLELAFASRFRH